MKVVWVKILIDIFFVILCAFNVIYDIEKNSWGWFAFDGAILGLWLYWFFGDTEELKRSRAK